MKTEVYLGDCLTIMRQLDADCVNLIYLDPPFFTQKIHTLRSRDRQQEFSFADLWVSHAEYAEFLKARLQEMWRILAPTGSIFFHCDRKASHIARLLLDSVFGPDQFRSEIIWCYRRWSNSREGLLPAHQTIYYYTKSDNHTFHLHFQDYSPSTNVDQILQRRKHDEWGKTVYERGEDGRVVSNGAKKGVPLSDVWDIPYLNPKAKERTGYPTQKPVLLLERIISLATNEGDLVLDPFCGSGTTLVAATLMNRNAIGIDSSGDAVAIARQRLQNPVKTDSQLLEEGRDAYQNADDEALSLLAGLDYVPVQRNKGIDAILKQDLDGLPILVRVQRPDETLLEAANSLYRAGRTKDAPLMFVVATRKGGYLPFADELPPGVVVVEAPAVRILEALAQSRAAVG
ncbi:MAG: DNA methyltransferase [Chloroflexota bacterium]